MSRDVMVIAFALLRHDLIRLLPVFDPLPPWRFRLLACCTAPFSSTTHIGSHPMPSRSQPVWQRSSSQLYIVCISLLCTYPTMGAICRNLVTKNPRGVLATWVPCILSLRRTPYQNHKSSAPWLVILILTLPTGSRRLRLFSLFVNSLLLLASIEFALEDYLRDAPDAAFTRLGAIYPDRVKLAVRYPHHKDPIYVMWRKVRGSSDLQAQPWTLGSPIILSEGDDWVNSTTISPLWPNTVYECNPLTPFASMVCFLRLVRFAGDLG